jgi:uncharacterized membrane protein HdeD (DUF308 family)
VIVLAITAPFAAALSIKLCFTSRWRPTGCWMMISGIVVGVAYLFVAGNPMRKPLLVSVLNFGMAYTIGSALGAGLCALWARITSMH